MVDVRSMESGDHFMITSRAHDTRGRAFLAGPWHGGFADLLLQLLFDLGDLRCKLLSARMTQGGGTGGYHSGFNRVT